MSLDLASVAVGAVVGCAGAVITGRIGGTDARRKEAWTAWTAANAAVRSGEPERLAQALNACELAWAHAGVPERVYDLFATTSQWGRRYYAVMGTDEKVPEEMYDAHQRVVDLLRHYLKRKWWKPAAPIRTQVHRTSRFVSAVGLLAEPFLLDLESGADMSGWEETPEET